MEAEKGLGIAKQALGMPEHAMAWTGGAGEAVGDSALTNRLLDRLLAMAHRYHSEGNLRQAIAMYWSLLENHPGTAQAQGARVSLQRSVTAY